MFYEGGEWDVLTQREGVQGSHDMGGVIRKALCVREQGQDRVRRQGPGASAIGRSLFRPEK